MRYGTPLAVLLVIHFLLLAGNAWTYSPTFDEPAHLVAGLSYWKFGTFDAYHVNPPLVRALATLPLHSVPHESNWNAAEAASSAFMVAREFLAAHGGYSRILFFVGRLAAAALSVAGAAACYCWARALWGHRSGLVAAGLWAFSPLVLGHGCLITPDIGATAVGLWASYFYMKWILRGGWCWTWIAGLFLGLALLSKFTFVVLVPLWLSLYAASVFARRQTMHLQMAAILVAALYVVNLGYLFEGTGDRLGSHRFVSRWLADDGNRERNRFEGTSLGRVPLPLPRNFVAGIDVQKASFEFGAWSYLRGEWRNGGWWHYYAYGFLVKTPIAMILLVLLGVGRIVLHHGNASFRRHRLPIIIAGSHGLVLFVIVSLETGFSHHLRYAFPAMPYAFILGAAAVAGHESGRWGRRLLWSSAILLALGATDSLRHYPYSIAYFNQLAGGPASGSRHMIESNLDWGQNFYMLDSYLKREAPGRRTLLVALIPYDPRILGVDVDEFADVWSLSHPMKAGHLSDLSDFDLVVLSADALLHRLDRFAEYRDAEPTAVVGYGLFVFEAPGAEQRLPR